MLKLWKSRKFKTNTEHRRCPIRKFSRQATHDYPIHEKDGAVLVSLSGPNHKACATKVHQHLSEIESRENDQDEAQSKQKLSVHTIHVIQAPCTFHGVEKGVNVENGAAKSDIHDTFLPKQNQNLQNVCIHTEEKTVASDEPVKEESADACTHVKCTSRPIVRKKSVKRGIFFWKKRGKNQNGMKIAPVDQQQDEENGEECREAKYKDPSKTDKNVNKTVINDKNGVKKKIAFWRKNKSSHTGKKVAPTEQEQSDKHGGHAIEGDSCPVKKGADIITSTTSKLANVNNGDAILVKEVAEITTTTAPILVNQTNVPYAKSIEVISHPDNGTPIHYHFHGEVHIHNHGLEISRNKTYYTSNSAPNGIINTGNRSKSTVNIDGTETSQQTRRKSF